MVGEATANTAKSCKGNWVFLYMSLGLVKENEYESGVLSGGFSDYIDEAGAIGSLAMAGDHLKNWSISLIASSNE